MVHTVQERVSMKLSRKTNVASSSHPVWGPRDREDEREGIKEKKTKKVKKQQGPHAG